jgi:hypothetical protein
VTRTISAAVLAAISSLSYAGSSALPPASSLTTGLGGNPYSVYGAHLNPAAGDTLIAPDEDWRLNYLPSVTFGVEVGPVDNFLDDIDELIDLLENPELTMESVDETLNRFNSTLERIGDDGYLQTVARIHAPLTPLHWRPDFIKGTFSADISITTEARLNVLDDELAFDPQNLGFTTSTAAYIKSGIEKAVSVSYSRPLLESKLEDGSDRQLLVGVSLNGYQLDLSKQVFLLQMLDGRDIDEVMRDEYDQNMVSSTGFGLDVGILWRAGRYTAGVTVTNINEPSFDFGPIGVDCSLRTDGSTERSNCEAASAFADAGELRRNETHTKYAVAHAENSFAIRDNWIVTAGMDLAEYNDMVGDEHQWATVATAVYPKIPFLPDARVGYRKNLVGSELSSITAGVGLFGLTLDVEWGLESTAVDGQAIPRRFAFALGFEERF